MDDWRDIPGYPNYMVNAYGNVLNKSTDRVMTGSTKHGVVQFTLKPGDIRLTSSKAKTLTAHRLVAAAFLDIPLTARVTHKDGDNYNNHWSNLEVK